MNRAVKNLAKSAYGRLMPRGARNSLRLWTMLQTPDRAPRMITSFDAQPVVVLAPHMDDEVIGCGATLHRHVQAGAAVTCVYMTDGRSGDLNLPAAEVAKMIEGRKEESRRATKLLGISDLVFLDGPDGSLSELPALVDRVAGIINEKSAAWVYLPALTDNHKDHWATNRIFHAALKQCRQEIAIRGYEIWSPTPANVMVDITEIIDLKKKAIEEFASQTQFVDYTHVSLGLAAYRSNVHMLGRGYAEAFLQTTVAEYRKLYEAILIRPGARATA